MALYEAGALDARQLEEGGGFARLFRLSDRLYVSHVRGHMRASHAALFIEYSEMMVSMTPRGLRVFHEWTEMTGYDAPCRKLLTEWTHAHLAAFEQAHVSFRSRLVGMGVQVANLFLGGIIQVHGSRLALEAALARAVDEESGLLRASWRPPG